MSLEQFLENYRDTIDRLYATSNAAAWHVSRPSFGSRLWRSFERRFDADSSAVSHAEGKGFLDSLYATDLALAIGCGDGDAEAWRHLSTRQPVDREQLVSDCIIHHPVSRVLDISENCSKSTRVRAIRDHTWTRRTHPAPLIARNRRNLSGRDLPRSADHRLRFAPSTLQTTKSIRSSSAIANRPVWVPTPTPVPVLMPIPQSRRPGVRARQFVNQVLDSCYS
jgi:hypothetical protein